jgi:hypothetical protein
MATYSVTINEKTAKGKSILTILHSMSDVVDIVPQNPASMLLDQTIQGAKEAIEIKAGKRKGKTLEALLNEK